MLKHLEISNKNIGVKEISEAEQSLDDSDIWAGFDEDGNRVAETDDEEQYKLVPWDCIVWCPKAISCHWIQLTTYQIM